jgi:predicted nucleotidyltransferase
MRRDQALDRLTSHRNELDGFKVASISVFGSVARDEAQEGSDVDLLVEFSEPVGLFHFVRLKRYLEDILGARVDLVTPGALKSQLRERILSEAIRAA